MQGNVNIPDSTITTNLSFRQLVLMNMQQLTNFPYIENDFDALTDYELLCLVVKFLNDVIANQNEQTDSITRMYESFLALQEYVNNTKDTLEDAFNELDDYVRNYFDNLDVQDEINNKLDEMAESGQLTDIIAQYLGLAGMIAFDTVADMKEAQNLVNGSKCRTLGFHSVNDGGGAFYKIRTVTNDDVVDESSIIEVYDDLLVAELIIEDEMNVKQFGAYGDNTHDDTTAIQIAVNKNDNISFNQGTYIISDNIYLNNNNNIKGNNSTIYNTANHPALRCNNKNNIIIDGLIITDNNLGNNQHGLFLIGNDFLVKNCVIDHVGGDGMLFETGKNITVDKCKILNAGRISLLTFEGDNVTYKNIYIKGGGHKYVCQFKSCINSTMENIIIEEGTEISCLSSIQSLSENPDPVISKNITIKNIKIIDHGKTWTPEDENKVACLFEGFNYHVSDIQILNSYTGGIKTELSDSTVENINIDGYGLNNSNNIGAYFTDATDYGDNNIINNIFIKNGSYQGMRTHLNNSSITNINIEDCGTSALPQFASADSNTVIDNILLVAKNIDCRGLGFSYSTLSADNSNYTNIKRIKADGFTGWDISGSSLPSTIYINCTDNVKWNAGRGTLTCPFVYDHGIVTMYNRSSSATGSLTPTAGDTIYFDPATKLSTGYFGTYYNGSEWINIIPLS